MITTHVGSCNVEIQIMLQCTITCRSIHTVGEQSEAKKRSPELCLFSECCNSRWFLQVRWQQVMYMCTEIGLFATIFSFESSSEHKYSRFRFVKWEHTFLIAVAFYVVIRHGIML